MSLNDYLNCSSALLVDEINSVLRQVFNRPLFVIESSFESQIEHIEAMEPEIQMAVMSLLQLRPYQIKEHVNMLFARDSLQSQAPHSLGWAPIESFLANDHLDSRELQFGGGGGFGFQVYCNGVEVISAGMGGGGGFRGRIGRGEVSDASFGGGGGGGMQLSHNLSYPLTEGDCYSRGGGGGCGSKQSGHRVGHKGAWVACGDRRDDEETTAGTWTSLLRHQFSSSAFESQCRELSVMGGGGGGGGGGSEGGNGGGGGVGYYFSFTLSNWNQTEVLDATTEDQYSAENSTEQFNVGRYLQLFADECGGYSDRECICKEVYVLIDKCKHAHDTSTLFKANRCDIWQSNWIDKALGCSDFGNGQIRDKKVSNWHKVNPASGNFNFLEPQCGNQFTLTLNQTLQSTFNSDNKYSLILVSFCISCVLATAIFCFLYCLQIKKTEVRYYLVSSASETNIAKN